MNKKIILLVLPLIIIIVLILIMKDKNIYNNLTIKYNEDIGVYTVYNQDNIEITEKNYQKDISNLIHNLLNNKIYNAKKPLMILNPYGTNLTGLYINFYTLKKTRIEYTISVEGEDIPDFTRTLNGGLTRKHEGQIIGLLQGYENTIEIKLYNKKNKIIKTYYFKINIPDFHTPSIKKLDSEYNDINEISDGLYVICSTMNKNDYTTHPTSFYDKYGILRAEFTSKSGIDTYRIELINNNLLYSIQPQVYVLVNNLGKIINLYKSEHNINHENIYNKYDNSILYITETDKIRKLNLNNNNDTLLVDLGELFKEYKDKAVKYHKQNFDEQKILDWAHINSIEIVNKDDIILSARETSSIIYITNINKNPEIKYIIAPQKIYKNTEYTKYLLKQVGSFNIHAGQHTALMQKDNSLKDGEYYLIFYNNNYAPPKDAIFNTGWEKEIKGVGTNEKPAKNSFYYKYLVNENEKTFTLIESINVPYSKNISNVQTLEKGYLINSGAISTIEEYNENKELILTLKTKEPYTFYRIYKYDMKSFWFDK